MMVFEFIFMEKHIIKYLDIKENFQNIRNKLIRIMRIRKYKPISLKKAVVN